MHLRRLDLNLLVALDALLTTQNVTRAADQLAVSQPAMSGALNRLREHFQDDLIRRSGRAMVLTPFGEVLTPRVREFVARATAMAEMRPTFDPGQSDRTFTILASDYAIAIFLPQVLQVLAQEAPHLQLRLEAKSAEYEHRFALGLIDFIIGPRGTVLPDFPSESLFEDEYVCVVAAGNKAFGTSLTREQFLEAGHVARLSPPATEAGGFEREIMALGIERRIVATVPAFDMLPRMVAGTPWIATMQRRLAEQADPGAVRVLRHPLPLPKLAIMLQWPGELEGEGGHQWLRARLLAVAAGICAERMGAVKPAASGSGWHRLTPMR